MSPDSSDDTTITGALVFSVYECPPESSRRCITPKASVIFSTVAVETPLFLFAWDKVGCETLKVSASCC